ncbi:MAG: glutathione S-transferase [Alphaproteobacteria bacterium]|nr:glutathione S-transferase [Alphaproteobacteria bacterium]
MLEKKIQLYSLNTPNGQKVSVALEETGLPYDAHTVDITKGEQFEESFVALNPNSKIPVLVDPYGPDGNPLSIMESGAILLYLAEKTGKFLPRDPRLRCQTLQWLFFQMAGVGPMFGQFGHFYRYAKDKCDHPYPINRYTTETRRLLTVLDKQLESKTYIVGSEYTVADMAIFPWVDCLRVYYKAEDHLNLQEFKNVSRWLESCLARPAVKRGMQVCAISD